MPICTAPILMSESFSIFGTFLKRIKGKNTSNARANLATITNHAYNYQIPHSAPLLESFLILKNSRILA